MRDVRIPFAAATGLALIAAGAAWGGSVAPDAETVSEGYSYLRLGTGQQVVSFQREGRVLQVHGRDMATGADPRTSGESFIEDNGHLWNVTSDDLHEGVLYADGAFNKGLMYNAETGFYKLRLLRYTQFEGNIPVFRSELKVVVRNVPGFPLVLANSSLRDLGGFAVPATAKIDQNQMQRIAQRELGAGAQLVTQPELVVWAGLDTDVDIPTLAVQFIAERGVFANIQNFEKWLYIIDPSNGRVIYAEDQVHNVDVTGNVSGWTTDGQSSNPCSTTSIRGLPYARVNIGGTVAFADENGDFTIPNGGNTDVTVDSRVWGSWFRAVNFGGSNALLSQVVTPPGPANFIHNESGEQFRTAEVDAYLQVNICRDYILDLDPTFPINDNAFPLHVNDTGSCNAFYQGGNLLFLRAGGGCPNTAYSSIVYHEYGHHLVARATGSQCQWGEGNSDVTATLVSDESELAFGFFGDCDQPLRDADNDCQYDVQSCSSCGGPCHNCGMLISGCNWDLRNNLLVTEPADYRTIGGQLWVASLFMHTTGQSITPADTINFLVADDNDGNLENGTPHYFEIANAFGDHNMAPPPLILLTFDIPTGEPEFINPSGGDTIQLAVQSANGDPKPDSGVLYYDDGTGNAIIEVPMEEIEPDLYEGTFPAAPCGNLVGYYFSVETTSDIRVFHPLGAPSDRFMATAAAGLDVTFQDDFENDLGWGVDGSASRGQWERGIPADCENGDPPNDADGSGQCYLTENEPNLCNRNVDFGNTILTSPVLDASSPDAAISYYRWYDNTQFANGRDDPFTVEVTDNGTDWVILEVIDPKSVEAEGGWYFKQFVVSNIVNNTDTFQVRFTAEDFGQFSVVEAGVDGVQIVTVICNDCTSDLDGSGAVDFGDILEVLAAWGPCAKGCPEDLDGSGSVGFGDILEILADWGPCA